MTLIIILFQLTSMYLSTGSKFCKKNRKNRICRFYFYFRTKLLSTRKHENS